MRDLYPKWIIEDGKVRIGKATFHKELCTKKENVIGGGWYYIDLKDRILWLYDKSIDFGTVTFKQLLEAKKAGPTRRRMKQIFEDFEWRFSDEGELDKAALNYKVVK